MKRYIFLFGLFILSSILFAEEKKPSSVNLMIPPVIIDIERSDNQELSVLIPEFTTMNLPVPGIKLPEPAAMSVVDLPSDIPLPSIDTPEQKSKAVFFSEGTLGAGIHNQLTGDIRLFKLGTGPRFSLLFSHDGLDGYGYRSAGEGYYFRKELFSGTLYGEKGGNSYTGEGSLAEDEDGFQNQSSLYSSIVRRFRTVSLMAGKKGKPWGWNISGDFQNAQKVFKGAIPFAFNTFAFLENSSLDFVKDSFSASLYESYQFDYIKEDDFLLNRMEIGLQSLYHFNPVDIGVQAGISYIPGNGFFYPYSLTLSGTFLKAVQFQIKGGRSIQIPNNYSLWASFPFGGNAEGITEKWFVNGRVSGMVFPGVDLHATWNWEDSGGFQNILNISSLNPVTGLFPYVESKNQQRLKVTGGFGFAFNREMYFSSEWSGQLLKNTDPLSPLHRISAALHYTKADEKVKGELNLSWDISPPERSPEIGGNLSLRIRKGIYMVIEADDILPVLFQQDRFLAGPYLKPSGTIAMSLKISL